MVSGNIVEREKYLGFRFRIGLKDGEDEEEISL